MGLLSGFGDDAFIPNQKILAFWIVEMLLKEPVKKFRAGHDRTEEALHRTVMLKIALTIRLIRRTSVFVRFGCMHCKSAKMFIMGFL